MTPGFKHFTIVEKTEDKECDFLLSVVSYFKAFLFLVLMSPVESSGETKFSFM